MDELIGAWASGSATLTGVGLIYLSLRNQRVLARPLSLTWRWVGAIMTLLSLVAWQTLLSSAASLFLWLSSIMVFLFVVPVLGLLGSRGRS